MGKDLDENQLREQDGLRKGYSMVDHLQTINQLIEKLMNSIDPFALATLPMKKHLTPKNIKQYLRH